MTNEHKQDQTDRRHDHAGHERWLADRHEAICGKLGGTARRLERQLITHRGR